MSAWPNFTVEAHLIRDTFQQARANGIFWIMLTVTGLCVALCLSVSVQGDAELYGKDEPGLFVPRGLTVKGKPIDPAVAKSQGVETIRGSMTLAFGAISVPLGRERKDAVLYLEFLLAWGFAGVLGVLLALVWTAGFMPTFLERNAASVLLVKPIGRWRLLLGKFLGVMTFVGFQVVLFVLLTWIALVARTEIWDMGYWVCIPFLLLQFGIFYSFSVLLAVITRSTVACVFGTLLYFLLAWAINFGDIIAHGKLESQDLPSSTLALADAAYWISPKPIDGGLILFNALEAQQHSEKNDLFKLLESGPVFSPILSILSSLVITAAFLALSAYEFKETDY